jgi:uncharacterized protein YacL
MEAITALAAIIGSALGIFMISYGWVGGWIGYEISEAVLIGGGATVALFATYNSIRGSTSAGGVLVLIPVIIGIMAFSRLTRYRWLARYPVSIVSGVGVGVVFGLTLRAQVINAGISTIQDILAGKPDPYSAWLVLIAVALTLLYFTYSERYSGIFHEKFSYIARSGRLFMFAAFGYLYGKTFVNEGIDRLTKYLIFTVKRTVDYFIASLFA